MPDTPFCSIDPWARSPREATSGIQPGDDVRHLAAELRRLRHELRDSRIEKATPEKTGSVRRPRKTEGGLHGRRSPR
jgi:hypothetical protein